MPLEVALTFNIGKDAKTMAKEIERKFLVKKSWQPKGKGEKIAQGYLCDDENKTVRVRIKGERGYLTVKSRTEGISRNEFEYEIPVEDAQKILLLCNKGVVEKTRYVENFGGFDWEIDVFAGANSPLVLAEIELPNEDTKFQKPDWAGEEVSLDSRYFNSYLSKHPYNKWENMEII